MAEPKIRFSNNGVMYPFWKTVKLNEIAERVTRKNKNNETDIPLTIASIEGLVDQRTYFGKTIASRDMSGYFLLKKGEFAYNKSYSVGYDYGSIKRLENYDKGALSTLYICFSINDDKISDFMTCYFNSLVWNKYMPMICAEGARNHGLLNVPPADFFTIPITMPSSLEEQQKIANFFTDIDEVISKSEAEVEALEKQKKAVMQKIFSQQIRFKKDDGTDYPEWEEKRISDITTQISLKNKSGNLPVYSVNNQLGFIPQSEQFEDREVASKDKSNYKVVSINQFAYNPSRINVGSIAYLKKDISVIVSPLYVVFECSKDVSCSFLDSWFKTDEFKKGRQKNTVGSVRDSINYEGLSNINIRIPCLEEQQKIADLLSEMDNAIDLAKQELEKWKLLKKGLLQQMFV